MLLVAASLRIKKGAETSRITEILVVKIRHRCKSKHPHMSTATRRWRTKAVLEGSVRSWSSKSTACQFPNISGKSCSLFFHGSWFLLRLPPREDGDEDALFSSSATFSPLKRKAGAAISSFFFFVPFCLTKFWSSFLISTAQLKELFTSIFCF